MSGVLRQCRYKCRWVELQSFLPSLNKVAAVGQGTWAGKTSLQQNLPVPNWGWGGCHLTDVVLYNGRKTVVVDTEVDVVVFVVVGCVLANVEVCRAPRNTCHHAVACSTVTSFFSCTYRRPIIQGFSTFSHAHRCYQRLVSRYLGPHQLLDIWAWKP